MRPAVFYGLLIFFTAFVVAYIALLGGLGGILDAR